MKLYGKSLLLLVLVVFCLWFGPQTSHASVWTETSARLESAQQVVISVWNRLTGFFTAFVSEPVRNLFYVNRSLSLTDISDPTLMISLGDINLPADDSLAVWTGDTDNRTVADPIIPTVAEPKPVATPVVDTKSDLIVKSDPEVVLSSDNERLTSTLIISYTNKERTGQSLGGLSSNSVLNNIALARVKDMFARQYFDHVAPDGREVQDEAKRYGYDYLVLGENLALGDFDSSQEMVTAWMNSPNHRANILGTSYTEMGAAVALSNFAGRPQWIGVQVFGKPGSACPKPTDGLKTTIETLQRNTNLKLARAKELTLSIQTAEQLGTKTAAEINADIAIYNTMVREINTESVALGAMIEEYNNAVRVFNTCLAR